VRLSTEEDRLPRVNLLSKGSSTGFGRASGRYRLIVVTSLALLSWGLTAVAVAILLGWHPRLGFGQWVLPI
jgi:hypothetical protein